MLLKQKGFLPFTASMTTITINHVSRGILRDFFENYHKITNTRLIECNYGIYFPTKEGNIVP